MDTRTTINTPPAPMLRGIPNILELNELEQERQPENLDVKLNSSNGRIEQNALLGFVRGEDEAIHLESVAVLSENVPAFGETEPTEDQDVHRRDARSPVAMSLISSTLSSHENKTATLEEIVDKIIPKVKATHTEIASKMNKDGAEYCLISLEKCLHSQWHQVGDTEGLKSDTEIASFLIRWYRNSTDDDKCSQCRGPLKMMCATCSLKESRCKGDKLRSKRHKRLVGGTLSVLSEAGRDRTRLRSLCRKRKASSQQDEVRKRHSAEATTVVYKAPAQQINSGSRRTGNAGTLPAVDGVLVGHGKPGFSPEQVTTKASQSLLRGRKSGDSLKALAASQRPKETEKSDAVDASGAGLTDLQTNVTLLVERRDCEDRREQKSCYNRLESDIETDLEIEVLFGNLEQALKREGEPRVPESDKKLTCKECFPALSSSDSLWKHRLVHAEPMPYQCQQCKAAFSQSGSLSRHVRLHERETASSCVKPHKCVYCGATFTQASSLRRHMRVRAGLKACKGRRYQVRLSKTLAEGSSTGGEKVYNCDQCWKQLSSAGNLKTHLKTHSSERPHQCQVCPAAFKLAGSLKSHMKTHTDVRPFMCELCGARAKRASDLALHMRTHSDERPYRCGQCGTPFKRSCDLLFHARTAHSAHKPFKCAQCDKAFKRPVDLAVHARKHTGERPFVCEQCGAAFAQSSNLSLHMRSHSDDKPFRCAECGAEFKLPGHLKRHTKTHGGQIACKQCGITFTSSYGLSIHMKRHKIDSTECVE